jgi:hypothetical protein
LTGAGKAFFAGEVWFLEKDRFVFNGSSGRYGVTEPEHLDEICTFFSELGFTVASTGFDEDTWRCLPHFDENELVWTEAK